MSQAEDTVGAVGEIRIDTLVITITPLSQAEELSLDRALRRGAEAAAGDHYTRCKPLLEAMRESPGDRLEAIREITRLTATRAPLSPAAFFEFRTSKDGLPIEIYARGKKATPGLDQKSLAAIITEENADRIAAALLDLLEGGDPNATR
jgi:hypothetical protein